MTFADVYLFCFLVGFGLTILALLSGAHHVHVHVPGFHHTHAAHGSLLSFGNIAAFLTWFGGVGYLLTRFSAIWLWLAFALAIAGGVLGGAIIFSISMKLMAQERPLDPADYEMVGVFGELTSAIRAGGVGELSYSQEGFRRSAAAKSEDGGAIAKGTEVLVTRYEKGIAYVRRWEELSDAKENR
jgi:membrane protein implicated in regulation of membrane protease activity